MNNGTEVACVYPNLSKPPRPVDCWRFPAGVVRCLRRIATRPAPLSQALSPADSGQCADRRSSPKV